MHFLTQLSVISGNIISKSLVDQLNGNEKTPQCGGSECTKTNFIKHTDE